MNETDLQSAKRNYGPKMSESRLLPIQKLPKLDRPNLTTVDNVGVASHSSIPSPVHTPKRTPKHSQQQDNPIERRKPKRNSNKRQRHSLPATASPSKMATDVFEDILDDAVDVRNSKVSLRNQDSNEEPSASVPISTVFMEVRGGFRPVDTRHQSSTTVPTSMDSVSQIKTLMSDLALTCHKRTSKLFRLCRGFLAGIAFAHCFITFSLAHDDWTDFVPHYTHLSYPFHTLFYFLNVICAISVFDTFDLFSLDLGGGPGLPVWRRVGILSVLLYPVALCMTLGLTNVDDRLGLYSRSNSTIWWEEFQDVSIVMDRWRSVSLVRSIFVILGWCLVETAPKEDKFRKHLTDIK